MAVTRRLGETSPVDVRLDDLDMICCPCRSDGQRRVVEAERVRVHQSEEDMLRARGFGQRMGFGRQPALIVVDMVKAFTDPAQLLGSDLDGPLEATSQLMKAAHTRAIPILLTTVIYEDPGMLDAGIWSLKQAGSVTLRAGTGGSDFDPRLPIRGTESILKKKYASCFFGTDLVPRLLAHRVDTLIIAGCTTSGCVRATAVDSVQNGFRPMVVREAVGDRSASAHAQSLSDIDAKYGDVVSLEQTLAYFLTVGAPH